MNLERCEYCGKRQRELEGGRCRVCGAREAAIRQRLHDNRLLRLDADDVLEHGMPIAFEPRPPTRVACDGCGESIEAGPGAERFTGWDGRTFRLHGACWKLLLAVSQE